MKCGTNVEAIIRYLTKNDIVLNVEQELLFVRLCFVDSLIRSRKHKRDEIVDLMKKRFEGLSTYRAAQDITDCHKVFGIARTISKTYLLSHHLDEIAQHVQLAKEAGRLDLLPKLNDSYTYALNSIPDAAPIEDPAPVSITYILTGATNTTTPKLSIPELLSQVDHFLNKKKNGGYIPYQEVSGNTGG